MQCGVREHVRDPDFSAGPTRYPVMGLPPNRLSSSPRELLPSDPSVKARRCVGTAPWHHRSHDHMLFVPCSSRPGPFWEDRLVWIWGLCHRGHPVEDRANIHIARVSCLSCCSREDLVCEFLQLLILLGAPRVLSQRIPSIGSKLYPSKFYPHWSQSKFHPA